MDRKYLYAGIAGALILSCLAIFLGLDAKLQMAAFAVGGLALAGHLYKRDNEPSEISFEGHWNDVLKVVGLYAVFAFLFPGVFLHSLQTPVGMLSNLAILAALFGIYVVGVPKSLKDELRMRFGRKIPYIIMIVVLFGLFRVYNDSRPMDFNVQCVDGIDNDGDGKTDLEDDDCANKLDTCEGNSCSAATLFRENEGTSSSGPNGGSNGGNGPRTNDPLGNGETIAHFMNPGQWTYLGFCGEGNSIEFVLNAADGPPPYSFRIRFGNEEVKFWDYTMTTVRKEKASKLTLQPGKPNYAKCPSTGAVTLMRPKGRAKVTVKSGAPEVYPAEWKEKAKQAGQRPQVFGVQPGKTKCSGGRSLCDAAFRNTSYRTRSGHEFVIRVSTPVKLAVKVDDKIIGEVKPDKWKKDGGEWKYCINGKAANGNIQVPSGTVSISNRGNVPVNVEVAAS